MNDYTKKEIEELKQKAMDIAEGSCVLEKIKPYISNKIKSDYKNLLKGTENPAVIYDLEYDLVLKLGEKEEIEQWNIDWLKIYQEWEEKYPIEGLNLNSITWFELI